MAYVFHCPKCGSDRVEVNTAYCWFMRCIVCDWFTNEYK